MKVLNLYAGIGGNRKLWGGEIDVTAVELNPEIAKIYQDFFPNDKVIVGDAHQYLLDHYKEFDFIWSSPPCPSHGDLRTLVVAQGKVAATYPDMKLYEEIIFLMKFFKGIYVVENVISYYNPLIVPQISGRHYFWTNFIITNYKTSKGKIENKAGMSLVNKMKLQKVNIPNFHKYDGDKRTLINNMIEPELGLHIFNCAFKIKQNRLSEILPLAVNKKEDDGLPPTSKEVGIRPTIL